MMISKKTRLDLKTASLIEPTKKNGESTTRIKAIDSIVEAAKKENPEKFKVCPYRLNALQPERRFSKCKGQTTLGNEVCEKREFCTRYLSPEAQDQHYGDYFHVGFDCKRFFNIHTGD